MSDKLDKALADAKKDLLPKGERDWDAIDAKLFARIEEDARATRLESAKVESSRVARLKGAVAYEQPRRAPVYVGYNPIGGSFVSDKFTGVVLSVAQPQ